MGLPAIEIDKVPVLDTAVGLFGSFTGEDPSAPTSVFDVGVTVIMIIYD